MAEGNESRASGVLKGYLEDAGLVEFDDGEASSSFEYVEPEERDPDGFFDYVLQTFVDFASEDFGGSDILLLSSNREAFDSFLKVSKLNVSVLRKSVMDGYGFEFEDPYHREGFVTGSTQFGQSLNEFVGMIDYDGQLETHNRLEYDKGLTEEQVNKAIEEVYEE